MTYMYPDPPYGGFDKDSPEARAAIERAGRQPFNGGKNWRPGRHLPTPTTYVEGRSRPSRNSCPECGERISRQSRHCKICAERLARMARAA